MDRIQKAIYVAIDAHSGQMDRGNHPYINHPIYLALQMDTEDEKIVALLHDVIEDSDKYTLLDITDMFGSTVSDSVDAITKRRGCETYQEYLIRVKSNYIATKVKLLDISHNLDKSRIENFNEKQKYKYDKMRKKYKNALVFLKS